MTSFQIAIKPNRLAAGRFVNRVRRKLQEALVADQKRTGMTQSKMAALIGVHRSVISRELNGRQDITLGRVAELAWAMGREIEFEVPVLEPQKGQNVFASEVHLKSSNRILSYAMFLSPNQQGAKINSTEKYLEIVN